MRGAENRFRNNRSHPRAAVAVIVLILEVRGTHDGKSIPRAFLKGQGFLSCKNGSTGCMKCELKLPTLTDEWRLRFLCYTLPKFRVLIAVISVRNGIQVPW